MSAFQWLRDKYDKTWPEPGANGVHSGTLASQLNTTLCRRSTIMSTVSRRSAESGSLEHLGSYRCFLLSCLFSDWHQRHCCAKTRGRPRRVAWPRQRHSDASASGKFLSGLAGGGGFLRRPPDDAACSSALPDLLRPPPRFPSQQPPPSVTSPPSHRILWKPRGRRVSNHSSSQSGHRTKATGSGVVKNTSEVFQRTGWVLGWSYWSALTTEWWITVDYISLFQCSVTERSLCFQNLLKIIHMNLMWRPLQHLNNLFHM